MRFRADIQGLRCVAVLSVVVFHVWPDALPGGFVGVDVFFVISGYLITSMLLEDLRHSGQISLIRFYDRRIRRILPAATVVLVAIAVSLPLLPIVRWEETATGIVAAALYIENWFLAFRAIDYLALDSAPSPVQHYWSLSIEEQFYLFWPLVMFSMAALFARLGSRAIAAFLVLLSIVVAASFIASLIVTAESPAFSYFASHTRFWELGLGALLSLLGLPKLSPTLAEACRTVGLAAIVLAFFVITTETAFPGYAAALPTLGTALAIAAGPAVHRIGPHGLIANPVAVYVGGISYSMYLWHWPLVSFAGVYLQDSLSLEVGLGVIVLTVALADLTKRFVEDPFRRVKARSVWVLGGGLGAITVCVALPLSARPLLSTGQTEVVAEAERYPGAAALFGAPIPEDVPLIPALAKLKNDIPSIYGRQCHVPMEQAIPIACHIGAPDGHFRIVIVGDSHAAMWTTAFEVIAGRVGWQVTSHTKSGCPLVKEPTTRPEFPNYEACLLWGRAVLEELRRDPPDVVFFGQVDNAALYDEEKGQKPAEAMAAAVADVWRDLKAAGIEVIAIRDTPWLGYEPGECLSRGGHCAAPREVAVKVGPADMITSAARIESVPVIDLIDAICTAEDCPAVIGNVIAWRDGNHLTATYVRTLAPYLLERLRRASSRIALALPEPTANSVMADTQAPH